MKRSHMSFMIVLSAVLLAWGPLVGAQGVNEVGDPSSQNDDMTRATTNPLKGEVISVEGNKLTVLDITTGRQKTFAVSGGSSRMNLRPGDKVRVSFSKGDPSLPVDINKE